MSILKRIKLAIVSCRARKEMASARSLTQKWSVLKILAGIPPRDVPVPVPFPTFEADLKKFSVSVKSWIGKNKGKPLRLAFGDSIAAFAKEYLSEFPAETNCCEPGSSMPHFLIMARAIAKIIGETPVSHVLIGSGGNAALGGQSLEKILSDVDVCLEGVARLFPDAKIIVYGFPPVYDVYATAIAPAVEHIMMQFVGRDNAVFLPLQKHFAGFLGLFPRIRYSSDGVHLNEAGIVRFDKLIKRALVVPAGSVVD